MLKCVLSYDVKMSQETSGYPLERMIFFYQSLKRAGNIWDPVNNAFYNEFVSSSKVFVVQVTELRKMTIYKFNVLVWCPSAKK